MPLSLDTPLQSGGSYTFHMSNSGNGLYAPTNASVIDAINTNLGDQCAGVSSSNPSILANNTYDINFTYVGNAGTTVGDLSAAFTSVLSSSVASDLVFSSADLGAVASPMIANAPPGAAAPTLIGGLSTTSALIYAAIGVVILIVAFGFSKGFGEGAAADV